MSHRSTYLDQPGRYWSEALQHDDPLVRRLACYALGVIGPSSAAAQQLREVARNDPASFVRVWAGAALAAVDPGNADALAALLAGTTDERMFVRSLAAWHLGRLSTDYAGIEAAEPRLQKLMHDADRSVRTEAGLALKRLQCKAGSPRELEVMEKEPPKAAAPNPGGSN